MKRLFLLVGFVATVGLTATAASQAAVVSNTTFPTSFTVTNPCNGEAVPLSGDQHVVVLLTTDNGGATHFAVHAQQHLTGVGASTGATYEFTNATNETFKGAVPGNPPGGNGAAEETVVATIPAVSQGNAPNFFVILRSRFTITPNGDVTSFTSEFFTECRG